MPSLFRVFFIFFGVFFVSGCEHSSISQNIPTQTSSCTYTEETKHLEGTSMEPKIKNGQTLTLLNGYYSCRENTPQLRDIVAARTGSNPLLLIKTVVATSFDHVELKGGMLLVNKKTVQNSAGEVYVFSNAEQAMLAQYISGFSLPKNTVFLLGDNLHHSVDSRKFGAIAISDIIGKFAIQ